MGRNGVVVVAAGKGTRMGTVESKQYLLLDGKPVLVHTLELFQRMAEIETIVLVTGADDIERCTAYVEQYRLSKVTAVVAGGTERQHSVRLGLGHLPEGLDVVAVHDAVRPFAKPGAVAACLRKAAEYGGAVLAVPVKDTIKVVDPAGQVVSTPERSSLWAVQTPQAFRFDLLRQAHDSADLAGFVGTDDAMLVERLGHKIHVVESDYANLKITTPDDLLLAERLLLQKSEPIRERNSIDSDRARI